MKLKCKFIIYGNHFSSLEIHKFLTVFKKALNISLKVLVVCLPPYVLKLNVSQILLRKGLCYSRERVDISFQNCPFFAFF